MTRIVGYLCVTATALVAMGCWDDIEHQLDDAVSNSAAVGSDDDAGADDLDVEVTDAGTPSTDLATVEGQGVVVLGYEGFGKECSDHDDCGDIPQGRCIHNILGIINAPGGYCVTCCDKAGIDNVAKNIDCVGVDDTYLIGINVCNDNEDCRKNYECIPVPYLNEAYPGRRYCMPDKEHQEPEEGAQMSDPECNWPWEEEV